MKMFEMFTTCAQRACVCVCVLSSCVHKADDEQQFGDAVEGQASWQVMLLWALVPGLRGTRHLLDPLDHLLVRRRGNGTQRFVQVLAAQVGEGPLLPPHCGALGSFGLRGQLTGLGQNLLQFGERHLCERKRRSQTAGEEEHEQPRESHPDDGSYLRSHSRSSSR